MARFSVVFASSEQEHGWRKEEASTPVSEIGADNTKTVVIQFNSYLEMTIDLVDKCKLDSRLC